MVTASNRKGFFRPSTVCTADLGWTRLSKARGMRILFRIFPLPPLNA